MRKTAKLRGSTFSLLCGLRELEGKGRDRDRLRRPRRLLSEKVEKKSRSVFSSHAFTLSSPGGFDLGGVGRSFPDPPLEEKVTPIPAKREGERGKWEEMYHRNTTLFNENYSLPAR